MSTGWPARRMLTGKKRVAAKAPPARAARWMKRRRDRRETLDFFMFVRLRSLRGCSGIMADLLEKTRGLTRQGQEQDGKRGEGGAGSEWIWFDLVGFGWRAEWGRLGGREARYGQDWRHGKERGRGWFDLV